MTHPDWICPECGSDAVARCGEERRHDLRSYLLRCGECGTLRQAVMTDGVARRFEAHLRAGAAAMRAALGRDLIGA
jgi:uncharacterized Zn finger protein